MSFIESTEKQTAPLADIHTPTGRRLHLAGNTPEAFWLLYAEHPKIETIKKIWEQYQNTNYENDIESNLFLQFYDYVTITHLRDEEYEMLVRMTWQSSRKLKREAVSAYRCIVGDKEWIKFACRLTATDRHLTEHSHSISNFGFTTIPIFKRSWSKALEEMLDSLEQIGQTEQWTIDYNE